MFWTLNDKRGVRLLRELIFIWIFLIPIKAFTEQRQEVKVEVSSYTVNKMTPLNEQTKNLLWRIINSEFDQDTVFRRTLSKSSPESLLEYIRENDITLDVFAADENGPLYLEMKGNRSSKINRYTQRSGSPILYDLIFPKTRVPMSYAVTLQKDSQRFNNTDKNMNPTWVAQNPNFAWSAYNLDSAFFDRKSEYFDRIVSNGNSIVIKRVTLPQNGTLVGELIEERTSKGTLVKVVTDQQDSVWKTLLFPEYYRPDGEILDRVRLKEVECYKTLKQVK